MKRLFVYLLIVVMILSGCSFTSLNKGQDNIIPALESVSLDPEGVTGSAISSMQGATTLDEVTSSIGGIQSNSSAGAIQPGYSVGQSNAGDIQTTSGTGAIQSTAVGVTEKTSSSEYSLVSNGTGKGVNKNVEDATSLLITLYYRSDNGFLVPVTRKVTKQDGIAKAVLTALVDDSANREQLDYYKLYPVIATGTKIRGMDIKNGTAIVDFSKDFDTCANADDEQKQLSSVVYTLTGFSNIHNVCIRVEGKPVSKLKNGTALFDNMNRNNIFINANQQEVADNRLKCDLFYNTVSDNNIYIVPVSVLIDCTDSSKVAENIINELVTKTSQSNYNTSFPKGTQLLSYTESDGVATLDFSGELIKYGGTENEKGIINQLYYTLGQIDGVKKAIVLVKGKKQTLPEGTEVWAEKTLPYAVNEVIDN